LHTSGDEVPGWKIKYQIYETEKTPVGQEKPMGSYPMVFIP